MKQLVFVDKHGGQIEMRGKGKRRGILREAETSGR